MFPNNLLKKIAPNGNSWRLCSSSPILVASSSHILSLTAFIVGIYNKKTTIKKPKILQKKFRT
jgi:hypothetical protein